MITSLAFKLLASAQINCLSTSIESRGTILRSLGRRLVMESGVQLELHRQM
jgi:hypothetical protein